ncbi:MAG: glycosyltransferase N-terminal domain-containing protein [Chlamydiales bacterium]
MNVLVFLYLFIIAPKLLLDRLLKGKRHPGFLQRCGWIIPKADRPVIWIHAVSVGEVKSAQTLFRALKQKESGVFFLITTTSATGQAEAKRSLPEADAFAYLPIDFSWIVKRWVKQLNPRRFILIESDFWWNLLSALRKNGTQISLVSGKLSERSARRFGIFPRFARKLFAHFDSICVQNTEHRDRFLPFAAPGQIHVTGNLKLDLISEPITHILDIPDPAITISCTHAPEEELLLDALKDGEWFFILAPRHPERFNDVAEMLTKKKIPFARWGAPERGKKVLLVDAMGQLPSCYAHSRLAILGGSFVDRIGGHNVLEPCLYGTPVLFGPYMHAQTEFAKRAIDAGVGIQVSLAEIRGAVVAFFSDKSREETMRRSTHTALEEARGATFRTMEILLQKKGFAKNTSAC